LLRAIFIFIKEKKIARVCLLKKEKKENKQSFCVFEPTLYVIFFSLLGKHT
jgi:hypothetical protein